MGDFAIFTKTSMAHSCMAHEALPVFYMEDHSILGLEVNRLSDTINILKNSGYDISVKNTHAQMRDTGAQGLMHAVGLLKENGIYAHITDMVDQVYQG